MKFLSHEVGLYSINLPQDHVWNTLVMSDLVPLVAFQNCQTSCKSEYAGLLVLHLMLLLNHWLIVQMWPAEIFSIGITLVVVLQNWFNWFHFLFFQGRSTCYSDRLHDFSVTIPRCYKDVYVNSFFLCTARLWNSLSIECFPLTQDLNGFKSRVKNLT